jgi:GTPase SAR1 family protein
MNTSEEIVASLRKAVGLLEDAYGGLRAQTIEACDRINHSTYRVAVFGPFNYGKSTLLNALLGEKALPMDLVPTTGAAITVKYGPAYRTCITHTDGSVQETLGLEALQHYAVLDERRHMRADVAAVAVYCPHPLLQIGLELIDLPGTDDEQAQNDFVQQQLLSADLVIQVLDGRKLMTLAERENLRDWLLDRGMNTVIFVVNFLNLMEGGDRHQVASRLRFLAESFRATLPDGVSNLYRVDALPALRARIKGDMAAASQTGLPELESALQTIGQQFAMGQSTEPILPRFTRLTCLNRLAADLSSALQSQIDELNIPQFNSAEAQRTAIKLKAQALIRQGFEQDIAKLRAWLKPNTLQAHYRLGLAQALADGRFLSWLSHNLQPAWAKRQTSVVSWVHQACEFFEQSQPTDLYVAFLDAPEVPNEAFSQHADIYLTQFSAAALDAIAAYETKAKPIIHTHLALPTAAISSAQAAQINLLQATLNDLTELSTRFA